MRELWMVNLLAIAIVKHRERARVYGLSHKEEKAIYDKKYRPLHLEKNREYLRLWRADNPDRAKAISVRQKSHRRKLGFIPLNEPFEGSEGHHVDKEHVIYILKKLHRSVKHNVWTGEGMREINELCHI